MKKPVQSIGKNQSKLPLLSKGIIPSQFNRRRLLHPNFGFTMVVNPSVRAVFDILKKDIGGTPIVTTCSAGANESCNSFAANCLGEGGHYNGDSNGGICCNGVDHPNNNPGSACA